MKISWSFGVVSPENKKRITDNFYEKATVFYSNYDKVIQIAGLCNARELRSVIDYIDLVIDDFELSDDAICYISKQIAQIEKILKCVRMGDRLCKKQ